MRNLLPLQLNLPILSLAKEEQQETSKDKKKEKKKSFSLNVDIRFSHFQNEMNVSVKEGKENSLTQMIIIINIVKIHFQTVFIV